MGDGDEHGLLKACVKGVKWDRAQAEPLLPEDDPLVDIPTMAAVLADMRGESRRSAQNQEGAGAAINRRNSLGDAIRAKVKDVEKFVRQLHRASPDKLAAYGLRSLRHQVVPRQEPAVRPRVAEVTPAAKKKVPVPA